MNDFLTKFKMSVPSMADLGLKVDEDLLRLVENTTHNFLDRLEDVVAPWTPATNVLETENSYEIRMEIPGFDGNTVSLKMKEQVLTISGKKDYIDNKTKGTFLRKECFSGEFARSFRLPNKANSEKIQATCNNGVLFITVDKKEEILPKTIEIKIHQ